MTIWDSVHVIPPSLHLRPCSAILRRDSRKQTSNSQPFHSVLLALLRQLGRHFQVLRTGAHHPFHSPRHISLEMLTSSCRCVQDLNPKPSFPCLQSFLLHLLLLHFLLLSFLPWYALDLQITTHSTSTNTCWIIGRCLIRLQCRRNRMGNASMSPSDVRS
jgi:hypothetical protein